MFSNLPVVPSGRVLAVLFLAMLSMTAPRPAEAQVDILPPVLVSATLDESDLVAGDTVTIRFEATDETGVGQVSFNYAFPDGRGLAIDALGAAIDAGEANYLITANIPDGTYVLQSVSLGDTMSPANFATYYPDGTIWSGLGVFIGLHDLDLRALDFTVAGNEVVDILPPVLVSATLDESDLVAGDTVTIRFEATDETGVGQVSFNYAFPDGRGLAIDALGAAIDAGEANYLITANIPDGTYVLQSVSLGDTMSPANFATYYPDGTIWSGLGVFIGLHDLDLRALDFTVAGNEFRVDIEEAVPDEDQPVEIEITPVDEMGGGQGGDAPDAMAANTAPRDIFVSATFGTLSAGEETGTRVRAQAMGSGRYVARLASGQAGTAVLTADIGDRGLPPLLVVFAETRQATTIVLTAPASSQPGAMINLTATVTSATGTPAGNVSFRRDAVEVGTAALNAQGTASLQIASLPVGSHQLTARYAGSAAHAPSTSDARVHLVETVNAAFLGGGAVFGQTAACAPVLGAGAHAVTVNYSPAELGGVPSGVSIIWQEGSEHLALWGQMAPSGDAFLGAAGRQSWTRFVFYPTRPLIRVVNRQTTRPLDAALTQAEELVLRLRVQNFAATPGCSVTLVGTLRRGG